MKHLVLIVLGMFYSSVIFAQTESSYGLKGRWGIGGGVGMNSVVGPDDFKNGALELDSKYVASFWGRYHLTDRFGFELAYTRLAYEYAAGGVLSDLEPITDIVDVSAAYRMWPQKAFHVLFQAGVGYARITDFAPTGPGSKESDLAIKARMGLEYMVTSSLMLALHGDFYKIEMGDTNVSSLRVLSPALAVTYYFGSSQPTMIDSDHDGIANSVDKCPETIAGTPVDANGCDVKPAQLDTDKDGVNDADDRCPGTPAGQPINEFGCAKTEKFEITLNVQFKPGSSVIDTQFVGDLEKFAEFLKKYPETKAEIEGHTDNTGAEKLNYSISQKRAQSVVNHLVKKLGIAKKRLTAKGFGPSQPIADNNSEDGRQKNRRVVAHVITVK